jgi:cytochrome c oxidase cbb3-type subunit 1
MKSEAHAEDTLPADAIALAVARASVAWLLVANLVGLLLAVLLLWPGAGGMLGPLTYGRWMPLHADFQLYGWCALPVAGVLLAAYLPRSRRSLLHTRIALAAWSFALVYSGIDWLAGGASGKLFVEWSGASRLVFPAVLALLWVVLADGWWTRRAQLSDAARWFTGIVLASLLLVPSILYLASSTGIYPVVNPHSGGATGTSLLGSTLGVVLIFLIIPHLLRLPKSSALDRNPAVVFMYILVPALLRRADAGHSSRVAAWIVWSWFVVCTAVLGFASHGHASHHSTAQILALATLLPWPLLVMLHWKRFNWDAGSLRWLAASLGWGVALVVTGLLTFLPGASERLKFTDALVAHAHLAMAGLLTSINVVLLLNLGSETATRRALGSSALYWMWQAGCLVQVVVLSCLGWLEGAEPPLLGATGGAVDLGYDARLLAGVLMAAAAAGWLWKLTLRSETPR